MLSKKELSKKELSREELKALHGEQYVESFDKGQSKFRLERLINSIPLSSEFKVVDFGCGIGLLVPLLSGKVEYFKMPSPDIIYSHNRKVF